MAFVTACCATHSMVCSNEAIFREPGSTQPWRLRSQTMNSGRSLRNTPLKGLLALILLGLFVPALACGLTSQMIETTTQLQIEKIQTKIQEVDETINMGNVTIGLTNEFPCPERKYYNETDELIAQDTYIS